jgi:hypothetical protein
MRHKNHGSYANVGDYVRLLNAQGRNTDIYGIVYDIETKPSVAGPKRFVWVHGMPEAVKDSFVRIVSSVSDDNAELDAFGSDLADI